MAEQKLHQRFRLLRFKSTVKMQNWAITVKVSIFFEKSIFCRLFTHAESYCFVLLLCKAVFCYQQGLRDRTFGYILKKVHAYIVCLHWMKWKKTYNK